MSKEVIFFGNGPLASAALAVLAPHFNIIFHARTREDLTTVAEVKKQHPAAHGILASFGVLIKKPLLDLFEPEGILNIHPSLLPLYRGPSPIESAILNGDRDFGVSIMKLATGMDAGPIYWQTTVSGLPLEKSEIYRILAETGAKWLVENLQHLPTPVPQDDKKATYTAKITREMGFVDPATESAEQILRKIIAYAGFPKVRMPLYGQNCLILAAEIAEQGTTPPLAVTCADGQILSLTRVQPEGRRPMDAKSFLNGYANKAKNS